MKIGPVIIEVRCRLERDAQEWEEIEDLSVEVGYPAKNGKVLWKEIGWLREQTEQIGRNFSHALWRKQNNQKILEFDFLPVEKAKSEAIERIYFIRKAITDLNGKRKIWTSRKLKGDFKDMHLEIHPKWEGENDQEQNP